MYISDESENVICCNWMEFYNKTGIVVSHRKSSMTDDDEFRH